MALVIPNTGSGPVNVFGETFLANATAFKLPATPRFPGTHTTATTVHRPGDDPRKECEECGNARGSNVRYYPT
jgi:hypothetical protein